MAKEEYKRNLDSIKQDSNFEFENKQIDLLKNILKNGYEMQYLQLEDAFRTIIVKNKEGVRPALPPLDEKYKWETYFDRPEGFDDEKFHKLFPHSTPILAYTEYLRDPISFFKKIETCTHEYQEVVVEDSRRNIRSYKELRCKLCHYTKNL